MSETICYKKIILETCCQIACTPNDEVEMCDEGLLYSNYFYL